MGGKNKQSQRTKNNVRPSNSGRSAEILNNAVKLDGSILSAGGKVLPALFPTMAVASLDQGLSPEFTLCFKKLNKKDPITRTKALQELTELVSSSKTEEVAAALSGWALAYRSLAMDTDRKVRESAQVCHRAVVSAVGRQLAPALRVLAPAWLCAQYDDHAPAAAVAANSLHKTFPKEKLPELVSFCKEEVMSHLIDNLSGVTEAVINKKPDSPEQKELQTVRVLRSSLQGLHYFVEHLPTQHDDWLWTRLTPLLSAIYWKLPHRDVNVRASWYGTTGRLVERFGAGSTPQFAQRALRVLLASAPAEQCAAQLWTCLLMIMHHITDWHTMLDKKELLTKRILDTLENGGWGDARHLCNILLPLLAHLPNDILTKHFYQSFFNAAFNGLEKKNIITSKMERQSWITSIAECLRYVSIQDTEFSLEVATSAHRTWLQHTLSSHRDVATCHHLIKTTAQNMTSLLKYWLKHNSDKYDQLIRNHWQNIGATISSQIENASLDEITQLIDGHILFLQNLKSSFLQEAKKQQCISFDGDAQKVESNKVVTEKCDPATVERYKHNMNDLVYRVCAQYFEFSGSKQMSVVLTPLITLLKEFDSEDLYLCIASGYGLDSVFSLYETVVRGWLSGDTMRSRSVADVVFMMIKYMSEEEQSCMFRTFQQFPPPVVEWCISLSLSHPYSSLRSVREWLLSSTVEHSVISLSRRLLNDESGDSILFMCLSHNDGDILISSSALRAVVGMFSASLRDSGAPLLERRARVSCSLASVRGDVTLLVTLFQLTADLRRGDDKLSVETWNEVRTTWKEVAATLPTEQRQLFLKQARDEIHSRLYKSDVDMKTIEHITSLCLDLLSCEGSPPDSAEIHQLTQLMFSLRPLAPSVQTCALRCDCIQSKLNCPFDDDNQLIKSIIQESSSLDIEEMTKEELLEYSNSLVFRAIYLRRLLLHHTCIEEEEAEECKWCDVLFREPYIQNEFCTVLYEYCVVVTLHDSYTFWPHYDIIQQTKVKLNAVLEAIINETSAEMIQTISSTLGARAASEGFYWASARAGYEKMTRGDQIEEVADSVDLEKLGDIVTGNGFFHSLQANIPLRPASSLRSKYLIMLRSVYAAYSADSSVIDATFVREVVACQAECDLDVVGNLYYRHNQVMLYERDITAAPWAQVLSNASIVEFLIELIRERGWELVERHWDFITIALCSLVNSLDKSKHNLGSTKVSLLAHSVLRLFSSVAMFCRDIPTVSLSRQPSTHVAHLITEWKDIFAPDLNDNMFKIVLYVLEPPLPALPACPLALSLSHLTRAAPLLQWSPLPAPRAAPPPPRAALTLAAALAAPAHALYKYLAGALMEVLMKPVVLDDAEKLAAWSAADEDASAVQLSLAQYSDAVTRMHAIADTALSHVRVATQTCSLVPFSDTYSICLGYLILHVRLAEYLRVARSDLRHHYLQIYTDNKFLPSLLSVSVRLLPDAVLSYMWSEADASPPAECAQYFTEHPGFKPDVASSAGDVAALACRCVLLACGTDASAVRAWAAQLGGASHARAGAAVRALVRGLVAPPLARDQLRAVRQAAGELEDAEVQIHWQSQEVVCQYVVESRRLELTVRLDSAHPLHPPRVTTGAGAGVGAMGGGKYDPAPAVHWLAVYLSAQNGTIVNALKMWLNAVSTRVSSAPQCYICYCRLQPSSGRLPATVCHQCKNRFHTQCLRKWFKSSSKSSCPLCRTNF